VASEVGLLNDASIHVIRAGGKRLRPKVVLLSYQAAGGTDLTRALPLAAAVELLHTASLVHDDINDRADLRRGRNTVNADWGDGLALLTGDYMFVRLFSLISSFDKAVIETFANTCVDLVEGETQQVLRLGDTDMSEETYLKIVTQKTAALFSTCGELGAIAAAAPDPQRAALKDYGLNLGIAFQIRDDTLDLMGTRDELGKPIARDLEQGKMSLATLYALKNSAKAAEILASRNVPAALQLLDESGSFAYGMQMAEMYCNKSRAALALLPASEAVTALADLAGFCVARLQ
jgi:octaprenyl-diphosphate synthase